MSDIQTWLDSLPCRGDETLVGVPPSALAELLDQVSKLREERDLYADSFQLWGLLEHEIRIAYDLPTGRYRAWLDGDPDQEAWADCAHHAVDELWQKTN